MDMIGSLVTTFGIGGALVWYLYWTTSKTIPELTKTHTDTTERIADKFVQSLVEEREARSRDLMEERVARGKELESLQNWIGSNACRFRNHEDSK